MQEDGNNKMSYTDQRDHQSGWLHYETVHSLKDFKSVQIVIFSMERQLSY